MVLMRRKNVEMTVMDADVEEYITRGFKRVTVPVSEFVFVDTDIGEEEVAVKPRPKAAPRKSGKQEEIKYG